MAKIFRHYLPRSLTLLGLVEILIVFTSVYTGMHVYIANTASDTTASPELLFPKAVLFTSIIFCAMFASGLYWHYQQRNLREILARVVVGFLSGVMVVFGVCYAFSIAIPPSDACIEVVKISFISVLCVHVVHHLVSTSDTLKQRVLVLGVGAAARKLFAVKAADVEFVAYIPVSNQGEYEIQQRPPITDESLRELVRENNIQEIIVALDERLKAMPSDGWLDCKLDGIAITDVSDFMERCFGKIDLSALNHSRIIFSKGFRVTPLQKFLKRLVDVVVSVLLLVLTWPAMVFAALAILIESRGRGPVFYAQERVGQGGLPFKIFKFRSMRLDAEKSGVPQYAQENDPRVTKVGRILRDLRIDEIPQTINVLRGEMSFVGPRPERPEFVQQYLTKIPYYGLRHEIKPGITGWAQISYPYGSGERDAVEKLQYDLYYLKNYGLLLDVNIIFQTAHVVLSRNAVR